LVLTAILKNNPIPIAYRLNYVVNFYVGPLVKSMEETHRNEIALRSTPWPWPRPRRQCIRSGPTHLPINHGNHA
jgi:hypothetical protein